jgi:hypothetical protein
MKATALITEKAQDSPLAFPDKKSLEKEGSPKTNPRFVSDAFLIKNMDERRSILLNLRPIGFSREFGLNE